MRSFLSPPFPRTSPVASPARRLSESACRAAADSGASAASSYAAAIRSGSDVPVICAWSSATEAWTAVGPTPRPPAGQPRR